MSFKNLTAKQQQFVAEYLVDLNATAAYKRAGYTYKNDNVAGVEAAKLLKNPKIVAQIQVTMDKRAERTEITQDEVLKKWWALANADANELVEFRRGACRYCHGDGHRYQRTQGEYLVASKGDEGIEPDDDGGVGFSPKREPHPECPECFGDGRGYPVFKDTRTLSAAGRELYAGVKQTKDGIEVKMQARDKALEMVARHLGMFIDRKEIGGPGDFGDLTDAELERQIAEADRALSESERAINTARTQASKTAAAEGKAAPPRKT